MSAATPAPSTPDASGAAASPTATAQDSGGLSSTDKLVLDYLRTRGHAAAEKVFRESLEGASPTDRPAPSSSTISSDDLATKIAVYAQKPTRPGENMLKDSSAALSELAAMGNPSNIQNLIASIGPVGAEEILSLDPTDKQEGFRELEAWVDGSLDMYRVRAMLIIPVNVVY